MLRVRVELSAEGSYTEDLEDTLFFRWSLIARPLDDTDTTPPTHDGGPVAAFTAESLGLFTISVTAVGANGGCSEPSTLIIAVFSSLSPLYEGTALDTSWVWQLLPDFWSQMNREARHRAELGWRGLTQLLGSDLTRAFDTDTSKSIDDIQDTRTIRWYRIPLASDVPRATWRVYLRRTTTVTRSDGRTIRTLDRLIPNVSRSVSTTGRIVSADVVRVYSALAQSFTPSTLDRGATIYVESRGVRYSGRIVHVVRAEAGWGEYIISGVALPVDAQSDEARVDVVLTYTPVESRTLPVEMAGRASFLTSYGLSGTLESSYADEGDTLNVYPAVALDNAMRSGVSAGDRVVVTLVDRASNRAVDIRLQVAGVTESFVLVKPPEGVSFTDLLRAASYVFVSGPDQRDELVRVLTQFAATTISRIEGTNITSDTAIAVQVFGTRLSLAVSRITVHRRHVVQTHGDLRSIGVLREFTEQQRLSESGTIRLTDSLRAVDMERRPLDMVEGSAFRLRVAPRVIAPASGERLSGKIVCPTQHIMVGDALVIQSGVGAGTYNVVDVFKDYIRTSTPIVRSFSGAVARVVRGGVQGSDTLIEFFDPLPDTAPDALWCEGAIFASHEVERRFGGIVGLTRRAWESTLPTATYMDAVRALFHARMGNQTPYAISRTLGVLLGLPYTPTRAVVRRIDNMGSKVRVLLEDVDANGDGLGRFQVHDVVITDEDSLLSDTGLTDGVEVGAIVEPMTVLSRGVSVLDSVDRRDDRVSQRHVFDVNVTASRVHLDANTSNLIHLATKVSKPAYTRINNILRSAHTDTIDIDTSIRLRARKQLFDTAGALGSSAEIQDDFIPGIGRLDLAPFVVLTTWFPRDGVIRRGAQGELLLTSARGGFLQPPTEISHAGRSYASRYIGVWIQEGDSVQLRARAHSPLFVKSVISDTEIELSGDITSGENLAFQVSRRISDGIADYNVDIEGAAFSVPIPAHIELSSLAPDDAVVFPDLALPAYRVRRVVRGVTHASVELVSTGYSPLPPEAITGLRRVRITRPSLAQSVRSRDVSTTQAPDIFSADAHALEPGDVVHTPHGERKVVAVAISQDRYYVDRPLVAPPDYTGGSVKVTRPLGITVEGETDSTSLGVRSAVTIVVRSSVPIAPSALRDVGGMTSLTRHRIPVRRFERGDIIRLVGDTIDGGEGMGVWRAIDTTGARAILNRPYTLPDRPLLVEWARQSPMHKANWRN
ncbi:MAG: hypothetical protein ACO32I_03535 [Candidatus Limnocylindrus sp.]